MVLWQGRWTPKTNTVLIKVLHLKRATDRTDTDTWTTRTLQHLWQVSDNGRHAAVCADSGTWSGVQHLVTAEGVSFGFCTPHTRGTRWSCCRWPYETEDKQRPYSENITNDTTCSLHRGGLGLIPRRFMRGGQSSATSFFSPASVIPPLLHPYLSQLLQAKISGKNSIVKWHLYSNNRLYLHTVSSNSAVFFTALQFYWHSYFIVMFCIRLLGNWPHATSHNMWI